MTYGFRPENWPAFQAELLERAITVADIEKIEFRPRIPHVARITLPHRAAPSSWQHAGGRLMRGVGLLKSTGPPKRTHGEDADTGTSSYKIKGDPGHV